MFDTIRTVLEATNAFLLHWSGLIVGLIALKLLVPKRVQYGIMLWFEVIAAKFLSVVHPDNLNSKRKFPRVSATPTFSGMTSNRHVPQKYGVQTDITDD